ncbi:hypothetical protein FRC14_001165 [Serendipita sp. 396]|nr:hypothetical protein FRC14_001165 [Serendipita sp. 396]KAG8786161.1 hypothetical protein FRC15_011991 [Serendipita sp. 397]KAG8801516.1 hypothetical protein FRC16_000300 [Serendipita sp. 398]KAG8809110.1 hypothetical protein FRC19_005449 [Serendipita sp. 401]KAG8871940.1 hypothetical protein FRC20_009970 [Serendipita sp. 405]
MHISPTFVGRDPPLPIFLTPLYQPYPLPKRKVPPKELGPIRVRDLYDEARDLSEEELEFESRCAELKDRGFMYMIPLGRTLTLHEEKIDRGSESPSEAGQAEEVSVENDVTVPINTTEDAEIEEEQDLDADIDDLDEEEEEEEDEEDDGDGDLNAEPSPEEDDAMSE